VVNDAELFERMLPTLKRVAGDNPVNIITPQTVAEDFSEFAEKTPGLFIFLGNGPPEVDPATLAANHSPFFDMHEPNLEVGVRIFTNLVVDYLNGQ
jgi:amidohydrolase